MCFKFIIITKPSSDQNLENLYIFSLLQNRIFFVCLKIYNLKKSITSKKRKKLKIPKMKNWIYIFIVIF